MIIKQGMRQWAPWPEALEEIVKGWKYKPGWLAYLSEADNGDNGGLRLYIISDSADSLQPNQRIRVRHEFIVPAATYNRDSWVRWLWDCVGKVETCHEMGEFFQIDGKRVFAPHHGNGEDPYQVWFLGTQEAADKSAGED